MISDHYMKVHYSFLKQFLALIPNHEEWGRGKSAPIPVLTGKRKSRTRAGIQKGIDKDICIYTDSQGVLNVLDSNGFSSKLVWG